MAKSPAHRLGELLGDFFEESIIEYLKPRVEEKGYYLDYRHLRPARNNGREVIGTDENGNRQELSSVDDAVEYIISYNDAGKAPILRYEITIQYSNGDEFTMKCSNKLKAIQFLNQYK